MLCAAVANVPRARNITSISLFLLVSPTRSGSVLCLHLCLPSTGCSDSIAPPGSYAAVQCGSTRYCSDGEALALREAPSKESTATCAITRVIARLPSPGSRQQRCLAATLSEIRGASADTRDRCKRSIPYFDHLPKPGFSEEDPSRCLGLPA